MRCAGIAISIALAERVILTPPPIQAEPIRRAAAQGSSGVHRSPYLPHNAWYLM